MTDYLDQFIQMLRSEKYYSAHTCSNYSRDLNLFQSHLLSQDIDDWTQVGYADVSGFAANDIARVARAAPSSANYPRYGVFTSS